MNEKILASNKMRSNTIFFMLGLGMLLAMIPYLGPAVVLPTLMVDLSIPSTALGYVISIYLIVSGICMFIGSYIQEKIGYLNTYHLGNISITLGILVSAIAPNFLVFMIGRGLSGFGFGLLSAAGGPIRAIWFKDKKYALANSFNQIMSCVGISLAFVLMTSLLAITGSWRNVMMIYASGSIVYTVACFFVMKYPVGVKEALEQKREGIKSGQIAKQENNLMRPFKFKDYWLILIHNIVYIAANTALLTYMVVYFNQEAGISVSAAALITSLLTICQIIGALVGGFLVAQTGRRKIWVIIFSVTYSLASITMILAGGNYFIVISMAVIIGICAFARIPGISMYYVELTDTYDPSLVGPAVAMVNGIPMLANIIISGLIGAMVFSPLGYGKTLIIVYAMCLASTIPLFWLKNIGPRAKNEIRNTENV
ncbi:MAG: MFS transporter [Eubacteriaceae bacterium]